MHEPGNQSPWKNQEGEPICSLHKKIEISRACETKLGCVLEERENAKINMKLAVNDAGHFWKYNCYACYAFIENLSFKQENS